jgi:pimeloyl-ACP methyl ester carboxylesterase
MTWKTVAVEQQEHGHTADIDRPLTFEQMANDTAALLRHLKIEGADFFGYSARAIVTRQIAIRHPDLVRRPFPNNDGYYPKVIARLKGVTPTPEALTKELEEDYASMAPNPKLWPTLIAKVREQAVEIKGWRPEDTQSMSAPTLVMVGDADIVRPERAVQMFRLLPQAQLAVLPGASHDSISERPDWVLSMIAAFLDAPMPKAK